MANPDDIITACKQLLTVPANTRECNEFVIAVAGKFGVIINGIADQILAAIAGVNWTQHGNDGEAASQAAGAGALVVGGMTSQALGSADGHVLIVVKGPLADDKYPTAYWESENGLIRPIGTLGRTVNFSFLPKDRDNVVYASRNV
jgi:hypothetical protein